jgi:nucleoside-diphosphate-sugar epimerase
VPITKKECSINIRLLGSLVLVTGASGFVASYIVKELLGRGFRVRGTVRSSAKGDALKASLKEHADKFEYVIVEDIKVVRTTSFDQLLIFKQLSVQDGAFTQAAKGVDGIIHTASPQATHVKTSVWEDLINPAVAGTVGALNASKNYPEVQRLVITSSYAGKPILWLVF